MNSENAADRVRRVLAAGARIADASDKLGREARTRLVATSGLSPEGVELALTSYLETTATDLEIERFVGDAGASPRAVVVLSANVCTAALRGIAFASATAPRVLVRPSRRDPVVAELVVRALSEDEAFVGIGASITLVSSIGALASGDELHAYGSDEAISAHAKKLPAGVVFRAHGAGFGAALIDDASDLTELAAALARDVVAFDQRGCLSPRIALVAGGEARAEAFAAALDRALAVLGERVPRGEIDASTRAELATYRTTLQAVGGFSGDAYHAVGFDPSPRALVLPPAARVVHVAAAEADAAHALLDPFAPRLTMLGLGGAVASDVARGWSCRIAPLGRMQKPPFDGPVDLRPYRR